VSLPITVWHQVPGGDTADLGTVTTGVSFATAAVGGFAHCQARLAGDLRRRLGYLGMVRLFHNGTLLWEGQLEDQSWSFEPESKTTTFRAFGLQSKLRETSVRRIWSKRAIDWQPLYSMSGNVYYASGLTAGATWDPSAWGARFGIEDSANADFQGATPEVVVYVATVGVTPSPGQCNGMLCTLPAGLSAVRVLCTGKQATAAFSGSRCTGSVQTSIDGSTWTLEGSAFVGDSVTGTDESVALTAGSRYVKLIGGTSNAGGALAAGNGFRFQNPRILGTSLVEDVAGGFYGGTILRDLIALVPGLTIGLIEEGSDFTIQAIERAVRDEALSVVQEVAGYYTREWAVWEDGQFDWRTKNLDEPGWIATLAHDVEQFEVDATLDGIARTVYVLYTDAASGLDAEASAIATSQRNPYVKQGVPKDVLVRAGFKMTANTSAQLASRATDELGVRPSAAGRVVLSATRMIANAVGAAAPAMMIRAGDNIIFADLPKTELFQQGRDGETLFHIVGTEVDLTAGKVTLELEGQQSRLDVLMARLALVTRTLTG
jgi:hypothetical protein